MDVRLCAHHDDRQVQVVDAVVAHAAQAHNVHQRPAAQQMQQAGGWIYILVGRQLEGICGRFLCNMITGWLLPAFHMGNHNLNLPYTTTMSAPQQVLLHAMSMYPSAFKRL